ncbi:MAG: hypothetical protein ACJA13_003018 [Paraglaciecola sp.]|jgi:hypothetical protein
MSLTKLLGIYKEILMKIVLLAFVLVLSGCAATSSDPTSQKVIVYSDTMEIIRDAADLAPQGVTGEFVLEIKTTGNQGPYVYLNTELDYRDQRCVTVAIHPNILPEFIAKYGAAPQEYFAGKSIVVKGQAQRARISFNSEGKPTGKYYYQTHIRVMDISQIEVVNGNT